MKKLSVTLTLRDGAAIECPGYRVEFEGDSAFALHRSLKRLTEDGRAYFCKDKWTVTDEVTGGKIYSSGDRHRGETAKQALENAREYLASQGGIAAVMEARARLLAIRRI